MSLGKQIRVVDHGLLETVRNLPCMSCVSLDPAGAREAVFENEIRSHPHHLVTVKHGGGDVAQNVMPLCFRHHRLVHDSGLSAFAGQFSAVKLWLEMAGWVFNGVSWDAPNCVYSRAEEE